YNIFPVSVYCFFFTNTPTPTIYTLSLHDALPICDLVHDPLDTVDLAEGELQVLVEQVVVLLGIEALGDRGRAREVAEEDGHLLALAGDRLARGADLVREGLGDLLGEPLDRIVGGRGRGIVHALRGEIAPTVGAEAELRGQARAAARAHERGARSTGVAESLAGNQLGRAARAAHTRRYAG